MNHTRETRDDAVIFNDSISGQSWPSTQPISGPVQGTEVVGFEADGFSATTITDKDTGESMAILSQASGDGGLFTYFNSHELRALGHMLLTVADEIQTVEGKVQ